MTPAEAFPSAKQRKRADAYLRIENAKYPQQLVEVPRDKWPSAIVNATPSPADGSFCERVFRSKHFLVQVFREPRYDAHRLSVCRTRLLMSGRWDDGISWDELMQIKRECGFGDRCAIEVYPKECDVVNVANMRHVWVLKDGLTFGWRRAAGPATDGAGAEAVAATAEAQP
jgi:hypothetical protein